MKYPLRIAMFKSILRSDRHDRQCKFRRALIEAEGRDVDEGDMGMEALKVGCDVSRQSMTRWEGEVWYDIAKVFQ